MKNAFLTFVFLTVASFSFASNEVTNSKAIEAVNTSEVVLKECSIKIKGTYDGKSVDVEVTVDADDCAVAAAKVLKAVVS